MTRRDVQQCDNCKKIEDRATSDSWRYTFPPKKWTTVGSYDACSKKCARELVNKTEAQEESKCSCCCKN